MNSELIYEYLDKIGRDGYKLGLDRMQKTLKILGNPEKTFKIIHVAGTNGKGSTSTFIYQTLKEHGYKTGLFTSPHIINFYDRIKIDKEISEEDFMRIFEIIKDTIEENDIKVSTFEFITLCAIYYFAEQKCEYVVLEVGMGGRLDATNATDETLLSVITKIGLDHQEYLGNTLEEIAYEKACIMKQNGRCVVYNQQESVLDVFREVAGERDNKLYICDFDEAKNIEINATHNSFDWKNLHIETRLVGRYQLFNAQLALSAIDVLRNELDLSDEDIINGFKNAYIPARFDVIRHNPTVIYDGGHNADGVKALKSSIESVFGDKKIVFVYGVLKDKDYNDEIKLIHENAKAFVTFTPDSPRALKAEDLKKQIEAYSDNVVAKSNVNDAVDYAIEHFKDDVIIIFGTLYSAEQAYEHL